MTTLDLNSDVIVTIKIIQKGHKLFGQKTSIKTELSELVELSISTILIDNGIFKWMGHPCDHYNLISIEY